MESRPAIEHYVIYDFPTDLPNRYVVRRWFISPHDPEPIADKRFGLHSPNLVIVQEYLAAMGLTKIMRSPGDAPEILETWL